MMEPISIAAITTGIVALVGTTGSCLAPLFRKQKNAIAQNFMEHDQDALSISYGGDQNSECSCMCFKYKTQKTPVFQFESKESNMDSKVSDAARISHGYQNYTSTQPRQTTAATNPSSEINHTSSQVATVTASDQNLLPDVDAEHFPQIPDSRNHFEATNLRVNTDGSFSADLISFFIQPSSNHAKETQITREILDRVIKPIQNMAASVTTQRFIAPTTEEHSETLNLLGEYDNFEI